MLYTKRRTGRHRMRWLEEVENDLKRMKVNGWKDKMRNREQCLSRKPRLTQGCSAK
jgi:hypothetical protein